MVSLRIMLEMFGFEKGSTEGFEQEEEGKIRMHTRVLANGEEWDNLVGVRSGGMEKKTPTMVISRDPAFL